jgi:hypothetical protein
VLRAGRCTKRPSVGQFRRARLCMPLRTDLQAIPEMSGCDHLSGRGSPAQTPADGVQRRAASVDWRAGQSHGYCTANARRLHLCKSTGVLGGAPGRTRGPSRFVPHRLGPAPVILPEARRRARPETLRVLWSGPFGGAPGRIRNCLPRVLRGVGDRPFWGKLPDQRPNPELTGVASRSHGVRSM